MKHEKALTALCGALLSFAVSWGALGCLISAFDLPVAEPGILALVCGGGALVCAGLLSLKWGGILLAGLMALAAGYLYRDGTLWEQFQCLLHAMTTVYSRAYGWGVVPVPEGVTSLVVDWPLAVLGSLVLITLCNSVVCRRGALLPTLLTVLVLSPCVVVTDTVPGEGWLLLVMAGLILLILTASVRRENPEHGLRLLLGAALPAVLALGALFLAVPQEGYVNQSAVLRENILLAAEKFPQLMETGMTQLTTRVQAKAPERVGLSTLGERIPFTYPVLEVTGPRGGTLYLRQRDYDTYDGLSWTSEEGRSEAFAGLGTETVALTIRTEGRKSYRYLPYYPEGGAALTGGSAENPGREQEYTLHQTLLPENWRQTAYRGSAASGQWQEYLALPEDTRQGAAAYLEGMNTQGLSNTARADIIAALVTSCAGYDLAPETMPEGETDFALWFLRAGEKGYCVHFATAATVLLRAAGVPARYVTGYLADTQPGVTATVTEADAHAWAEYYEPNLDAWLVLDATPAQEAAVPVSPAPAVTEPPTVPAQTSEPQTTTEAATEGTAPTAAQTQPTREAPQSHGVEPQPEKIQFPLWLLWLPLLAAALAGQRMVRLKWRRWRFRRGEPNQQALRRWREAERLSRILKECPPPELQELAQKAKFSQYTLTEEELSQFDRHIQEAIRRMRRSPWWRQLVYRFVYAAY